MDELKLGGPSREAPDPFSTVFVPASENHNNTESNLYVQQRANLDLQIKLNKSKQTIVNLKGENELL